MPKGETRAKRPKRPFNCPDGQRLSDGKRKADAGAKEFYNAPKGQKRDKRRKLLPSLRWRWHEVAEGSFAHICVSLAFLALLQETTHNRFVFQKSYNIFGLHSEKVITFLDLEVFKSFLAMKYHNVEKYRSGFAFLARLLAL